MVKQKILSAILFIGFMVFVIVNQTNAVCCRDRIEIHHICQRSISSALPHHIWPDGRVSCKVNVCNDGIVISRFGYCGVGKCNLVGCNCKGGCIHSNRTEAKVLRRFKEIYNVKTAIVAL